MISNEILILNTLKKYWGFDEFKNLQKDIVLSLLEGKDILALLPTGAGKSLCYQLPSLLLEGTALIISPLISLMRNQVIELNEKGIPSEYLSAELDDESEMIYENIASQKVKILYISPERLNSKDFLRKISSYKISLIAVDEAHCISEWGQDFRPSYLKIKNIKSLFPNVPILALTATATKKVTSDIIEKLELRNPIVYSNSFQRDNIKINCLEVSDKFQKIYNYLHFHQNNSGLIYVRTRKESEDLFHFLQSKGIGNIDYYHAGLSAEDKNNKQHTWQNQANHILIATNAFGMGIDKPDVRFIIHLSPPNSIENFYQEIGRAGRDGLVSESFLLWNKVELNDIDGLLSHQISSKSEFSKVISYLYSIFQVGENEIAENVFSFDFVKFQSLLKIPAAKIRNILKFLHHENLILYKEDKNSSSLKLLVNPNELDSLSKKDSYFLEILLRNIDGISQYPTIFSENELCKILGLNRQLFKERLVELQKNQYIEYVDGSLSQIKFLKERNSKDIEGKYWNMFLEIQRNKIQKWEEMKFFIQNSSHCRMKLILNYFDEKSEQNCGICDYCEKNLINNKDSNLPQKILEVLRQKPYQFDEISIQLYQFEKEEIFENLIQLLNTKQIKMYNYNTYMIYE